MAQVLVEVDDLNVACIPEYLPEISEVMNKAFIFGKWEHDEADFAGRHIKTSDDKVCMDQEKYILGKIMPVKLAKNRASNKTDRLNEEEFEAHRSLLYRINWVSHQTRPEASGVVSILASRLKDATVHDLQCLNKLAQHLRNTAQQSLTLHRFDCDSMVFVCASDAGGVDSLPVLPDEPGSCSDTIQGAWVIMACGEVPSASKKSKASILTWRSTKLKRRVSSTLAAEAVSFSMALAETEWLQVMFRDVTKGDVCRKDWRSSLLPYVAVLREDCALQARAPQCSITDAKSLYDSINKGNPTSRQDRRTSVELALISEAMEQAKGALRWAPHPKMIADALTKDDISKSNGALGELLRTSRLSLWDEDTELQWRKENSSFKRRSKGASEAIRQANSFLNEALKDLQVNSYLGVLTLDSSAR